MNEHQHFRVAALQIPLHWESRMKNLNYIEEKLKSHDLHAVDLIVLPEMFTSGFTMNAKANADGPEGEILEWMREQTQKGDFALTGSVIIEENNRYYNRLYFVFPNGKYEVYDKRHTFSYAGEHKMFAAGTTRLIVNFRGWKICPMICYDLRFPVWSRNTEAFDALIYVANWPESRIKAWDTLLPARSIENMCYTIGVNRVGEDGNHIHYNGHSAIFDALGIQIAFLEERAGMVYAELDRNELNQIRHKYRFLEDRDKFSLTHLSGNH